MQWYRQYAEFATDPKVQMMTEIMQRRLIMLFCMRCNGNETFPETEIAFHLRISESEWAETKSLFIEKGFIDKTNKVLNWDKRQYISDSSTERVKRFRKRHETVSETAPEQNRTDTEQKGKKSVSSLIFKENLCKSLKTKQKSGMYISNEDKKFIDDFEAEVKAKVKSGEI